ncbi:DUF5305 domain-containing protein [Halopenitus sp. H-Gu1]|uniref:DUF5305 domain-containing protein n=1 Tax=Halopenitus sp. H-Gu1 TaxID=3242697 RepID=UPI00359D0D5F
MSGRSRRVRMWVGDNYALIVVCLLLIGAVGGYLTYTTNVSPGMETETRQVSSWESHGEFSHQATVVNGTRAFEEGTQLRNRRVYFQEASPELSGEFVHSYTASDGGDLDVDLSTDLVLRSVETRNDDNETVFWRVTEPLNRTSVESLGPTEEATASFSTNVTEAATESSRIDEQLGGTPGSVEVAIVTTANVTGTRNGQQVDTIRTVRLPINPESGIYRVDDPGVVANSGSRSEEITVPVEYGLSRRVVGPLLTLLSALALVGLLHGRRTGTLSPSDAERRWVDYRSQRREFDDWITVGRPPEAADAVPSITVDSLKGLVDVAIDTDNRVIEDEAHGRYLVFDDDRVFRYDRPPEPDSGMADAPDDDSGKSGADRGTPGRGGRRNGADGEDIPDDSEDSDDDPSDADR